VLNHDRAQYWRPADGMERADLTLTFHRAQTFDGVVLMEHIQSGQRIEAFSLEYDDNGAWREFFRGTVVGYKRICRFPPVSSRTVRLRILRSRWYPTISFFGIYRSGEPVHTNKREFSE